MITFRREEWEEEDFPLGDGVADTEAEAVCPYCGEAVVIAVDPGSGVQQMYVEDCPVCCQPWNVNVSFDERGSASVDLRAQDD